MKQNQKLTHLSKPMNQNQCKPIDFCRDSNATQPASNDIEETLLDLEYIVYVEPKNNQDQNTLTR